MVIGCGSCLVQSILTLCLLLPYWWRHKTCLVFLKMQCCLAISGAMSIFIYSVQYSVPKVRSWPQVSPEVPAAVQRISPSSRACFPA